MKNFIKKMFHFVFKTQEGLYLVFGFLTTVVSLAVFALSAWLIGEEHSIINTVIKNAAGIIFAYFTNRSIVFKSKNMSAKAKTNEFIQFTVSRVITLFIDMGIVWLLYDKFALMPSTIASAIASVVVIVLNYFASRFLVFTEKGKGKKKEEKTDNN